MTGVRLIITMIGAACVAALISGGDVSARSCAEKDKNANGSCPAAKSGSDPLKLFQSLLQPTKPKPPARIHKPASTETASTAPTKTETPGTRAASTRTYAHRMRASAEGRDRALFPTRKGPASPSEVRTASDNHNAAFAEARAPQLASSKSVPAAIPAPVVAAAPVAAAPTRVASAAQGELRVASVIPSNLVEPKQSNEVNLTAGMAEPSSPPAPDRSWLGGLLAILGGALAAAAGARFVAT